MKPSPLGYLLLYGILGSAQLAIISVWSWKALGRPFPHISVLILCCFVLTLTSWGLGKVCGRVLTAIVAWHIRHNPGSWLRRLVVAARGTRT